ncbi:hypothetical protein A8B98_21325 [Hymenobacter sp. UV11]|nr:hypothetical protein A8B98_21325 [Hymenobacter sp. UV11]
MLGTTFVRTPIGLAIAAFIFFYPSLTTREAARISYMWSLFSEVRVRQAGVFWSALTIVGLFGATCIRVLPGICMAGLFVTGVGYAISHRRIAQRKTWPDLLSFVLIYLVHAVSGLL